MESTHGLIIVNLAFIFAMLLVVLSYFGNLVVQYIPAPVLVSVPGGINGTAAFQSFNGLTKTTYTTFFTTATEAIVIALLLALMMDVVISYYDPNPAEGIINIFILFVIAIEWIAIKIGITGINFLNTSNTGGVAPLAYSLFTSPYFITMVAFFIILSTVLHMRSTGGGGDGTARYNQEYGNTRISPS